MTRIGKSLRLAALLSLTALACAGVHAAAIGTFFGTPHITGQVGPGEFEEVVKNLSGHFDKPLSLKVAPDSNPEELLRIGLWLREQGPELHIRGSCIGACALFILDSGRSLRVAPGTVLAFSTFWEWPAVMKEQLDRGELFASEEAAIQSRERFVRQISPRTWSLTQARRQARLTQTRWPAWVLQFVDALTGQKVARLSFDEERFEINFEPRKHNCRWWIPGAEGLRQLGLSVERYTPPSVAEAARFLKVAEGSIYIGPALHDEQWPRQGLCIQAPGGHSFL